MWTQVAWGPLQATRRWKVQEPSLTVMMYVVIQVVGTTSEPGALDVPVVRDAKA